MAGKQITELESTNKISEGDLLFVRKTTSGTDKKINYTDLVESIGNPAIDGFVAIVDPLDSNTVILTPANGAKIHRYFVGMKISFVSPITSTGNVKIKVGSLTAKDFVQYHTTVTVDLQVDDYVEGVFIGDKFHRVNDLRSVQNIYSNEYKVILIEIAADESYTDIHLVSSIGLTKTSYYDGMSIAFRCNENTKGATAVYIDGLDRKFVIDGDAENFVLTPLYANQPVHAIYSSSSGAFIRDRYVVQDPTIVPIPNIPEPSDDEIEEGIIPDPIIPVQNSKEYTVDSVSTGANSFTSLKEAVNKILQNFPSGAEQGIKVTITINTTLNATNNLLAINQDLSWITLNSSNNIISINKNSTKGYIFTVEGEGSSFFDIQAGTTILVQNAIFGNGTHATFITAGGGAKIKLIDVTLNCPNLAYGIYLSNTSTLLMNRCTISGFVVNSITFNNLSKGTIGNTNITSTQYGDIIHMSLSQQGGVVIAITNCNLIVPPNYFAIGVAPYNNPTAVMSAISQSNSKAKLRNSLTGQEIPKNTTFANQIMYQVVGSQT